MTRRLGIVLLLLLIPVLLAVFPRETQTDDFELHQFTLNRLDNNFYCEGATFGDVSGDGQIDVVAGPFWYEGPAFEKRHAFYEAKTHSIEGYSACFFSFVHDFDGDDLQDILVIGFPGEEASWYKNPGSLSDDSAGFWERFIVFEGVDNESPTFGDITGDGLPELILLHEGQYGYASPDWTSPASPWQFVPVSEDRGLTKYTHGLGYGDVNGDGMLDLLEAKGWYEQSEGAGLWTYHPYEFAGGGSQMYAYDFDNDGDQDIVTADTAHSWGLAWHENLGEERFKRHVIMGRTPADNPYGVAFSQLHAIALVDMDNDGVKDIVTGKRFWAHMGKDPGGNEPPVLYWFKTKREEGGVVDFIPYLLDDLTGVGTQLVVADYNEDMLPDLVIANKKGISVYTHTIARVSQEAWVAAQPVARTKSE